MIQAQHAGGFTLPFLLGTLVGILSGALVGVLFARPVTSLIQRAFERLMGADEGEGPRLDLLLQ